MPPLDQLSPQDIDADDPALPLGDHLEELRRRLVLALAGIGVALGVTVYFGPALIAWIARPLLVAMDATGFPPQTYVTDPTAGFTGVYLPVTLVGAVVLASPWVLLQLWQFVAVGLYRHERKAVYVLAPFSTFMTALGVLFTYHVLLPVSLLFFLNFAATMYPPVAAGPPGPVMSVFLRAYGVHPRDLSVDGPAAPLPDPEETTPLGELATVGEPGPPASAPPADRGGPGPLRLPVRGEDPVEPAEGDAWVNAADGKLKLFLAGEVRELATTSRSLMTPLPKLDEFIRFATFMGLGVVAAFQVPVVMLVAGWTGLFDPALFAGGRRYALFASVVLGALITPTDVFSMLVLAVPLYLLFELGLLLMRFGQRRAERNPA